MGGMGITQFSKNYPMTLANLGLVIFAHYMNLSLSVSISSLKVVK